MYRRSAWLVAPALILSAMAPSRGPRAVAAPAPTRPAPGRQVLSTLPAPPYAFELSLENCAGPVRENANDDTACTFAVRLLDGAKVLDRFALAQTGCGPAEPTTIDRTLGADRDAKAFGTSDENCEIDVAVRTVELAPHVTALLLSQLQGFEERYRTHALMLARQGKLETLWSHDEEPSGAESTTTTVIPTLQTSAGSDIAFITTRLTPDGVVSKVSAARLHLDAASGAVQSQPLPDAGAPLFVLAAGAFKDAAATQTAREHCVDDLDVMRARVFPKLRVPAFFFGAVFANRKDAESDLTQLATCAKPEKGTILERGVARVKPPDRDH